MSLALVVIDSVSYRRLQTLKAKYYFAVPAGAAEMIADIPV
jgi:hypothetical protein